MSEPFLKWKIFLSRCANSRQKGLADFVEIDQRNVGFAGQPWLTDKGKALLKENPKLRNGLSAGAKWAIGAIVVPVIIALISLLW